MVLITDNTILYKTLELLYLMNTCCKETDYRISAQISSLSINKRVEKDTGQIISFIGLQKDKQERKLSQRRVNGY